MNTAKVLQAGISSHPESGKSLLRITVAYPYAVGGETSPTTWLWADEQAPIPRDGETASWDSGHVWIDGRAWRKREYDSNPTAPLH